MDRRGEGILTTGLTQALRRASKNLGPMIFHIDGSTAWVHVWVVGDMLNSPLRLGAQEPESAYLGHHVDASRASAGHRATLDEIQRPTSLDAISLMEAIEQRCLTLVPNVRARRRLLQVQSDLMRTRGSPSWQRAPIVTFDSWLRTQFVQLIDDGRESRTL